MTFSTMPLTGMNGERIRIRKNGGEWQEPIIEEK